MCLIEMISHAGDLGADGDVSSLHGSHRVLRARGFVGAGSTLISLRMGIGTHRGFESSGHCAAWGLMARVGAVRRLGRRKLNRCGSWCRMHMTMRSTRSGAAVLDVPAGGGDRDDLTATDWAGTVPAHPGRDGAPGGGAGRGGAARSRTATTRMRVTQEENPLRTDHTAGHGSSAGGLHPRWNPPPPIPAWTARFGAWKTRPRSP